MEPCKVICYDCDSVMHTHHAAGRAGSWSSASASPISIVKSVHSTRGVDQVRMV